MNINELEGRELDTLVADKVMGWRLVADHPNALTWDDDSGILYTWFATSYPNFRPSTDIAAAWLVVEKFEYVQLEIMHDGVDCEIWKSTEREFEEWTPVSEASAETAPLAICRAALMAAEAE